MIQEVRSPSHTRRAEAPNKLLALLTEEEWERLGPHLRYVELEQGKVIYEAGEPARHVCFPAGGVVSVVCTSPAGVGVEVGMVGREGMAGLPTAFGDGVTENRRAVVQLAGEGFLLDVDALRGEFARGGRFQQVLLRYAQAFLTFTTQSVFCQAFHGLEERLARWLAECRYRADSDELRLTQEYIAQMLGVRRAGVSEAISRLESQGLMAHARGALTVLDRGGLEASACECFGVIRAEFDRLFDA